MTLCFSLSPLDHSISLYISTNPSGYPSNEGTDSDGVDPYSLSTDVEFLPPVKFANDPINLVEKSLNIFQSQLGNSIILKSHPLFCSIVRLLNLSGSVQELNQLSQITPGERQFDRLEDDHSPNIHPNINDHFHSSPQAFTLSRERKLQIQSHITTITKLLLNSDVEWYIPALWELLFIVLGYTDDVAYQPLSHHLFNLFQKYLPIQDVLGHQGTLSSLIDEISNSQPSPEAHLKYWPAVYQCVLRGYFDEARQLLRQHSESSLDSIYSSQSDQWGIIDSLLSTYPMFSLDSNWSSQDSKNKQLWLQSARRFLHLKFANENLNNILYILSGHTSTLVRESISWQVLFCANILYSVSSIDTTNISSFFQHLFSIQPRSNWEDPINSLFISVLLFQFEDLFRNLTVYDYLWSNFAIGTWFRAHIAPFIYSHPFLELNPKLFANSLSAYARYLFSFDHSFFNVALDYMIPVVPPSTIKSSFESNSLTSDPKNRQTENSQMPNPDPIWISINQLIPPSGLSREASQISSNINNNNEDDDNTLSSGLMSLLSPHAFHPPIHFLPTTPFLYSQIDNTTILTLIRNSMCISNSHLYASFLSSLSFSVAHRFLLANNLAASLWWFYNGIVNSPPSSVPYYSMWQVFERLNTQMHYLGNDSALFSNLDDMLSYFIEAYPSHSETIIPIVELLRKYASFYSAKQNQNYEMLSASLFDLLVDNSVPPQFWNSIKTELPTIIQHCTWSASELFLLLDVILLKQMADAGNTGDSDNINTLVPGLSFGEIPKKTVPNQLSTTEIGTPDFVFGNSITSKLLFKLSQVSPENFDFADLNRATKPHENRENTTDPFSFPSSLRMEEEDQPNSFGFTKLVIGGDFSGGRKFLGASRTQIKSKPSNPKSNSRIDNFKYSWTTTKLKSFQ